MSRESRLIAVLLVFGVAGVGTLSFVASQYRKRLPPRTASLTTSRRVDTTSGMLRPDLTVPDTAAARRVDAFLAARAAGRSVCERFGIQPHDRLWSAEVLAAYRIARLQTFTAHKVADDDYAAVRSSWRAWSTGQGRAEAALAAAFEARRPASADESVGRFEALDEAVK